MKTTMKGIGIEYYAGKRIGIETLYDLSEGGVIFEGGFYCEDFPCRSFFDMWNAGIHDGTYYVEVLTRTVIKDTSSFFNDEDGARICLFPTAKQHLRWRILAKNPTRQEFLSIMELLHQQFLTPRLHPL
jgi:hypothetical protein